MPKTEKNAETAIPHRTVLNLSFFEGEMTDAVAHALPYAMTRRPFAVYTPCATVAARALRDPALALLLSQADLSLPDGKGISIAARLSDGVGLRRITGIDFAESLLAALAPKNPRVFFYGGRRGVAEKAAQVMRGRYPGLIISAADGYGQDPRERIRLFCPHVVCVGLGVGRQEAWIAENKNDIGGVFIGVGGTFDVWSGEKKRAPLVFQRAGLEWAYRTLREPRRIKRLLPLPSYFAECLRVGQIAKKKAKKRGAV